MVQMIHERMIKESDDDIDDDDDLSVAEELTFEEAERRRHEEAVRDGRHVDLTTGGVCRGAGGDGG
tara:strand:- start:154 stop:351 length:198 start_codon:yes stop_codon:yes gene_type:complete